MNRLLTLAFTGCLILLPSFAGANWGLSEDDFDQCEVSLQSDVTIDADHIEIVTDNGERMVIEGDDALSVNGRDIALDADERALVRSYAQQIRGTIPEIVAIALEGVEIGLTAVTEVFYALSEDGPPQSLMDTLEGIQEAVTARMQRDGNSIRFRGDQIDGLEAALEDLEPAIEQAVSEALGAMFVSLGESMRDGDADLGELMAEFTEKQERFERDLEARVGARADALERRAEALCERVQELEDTERSLHDEVAATRDFSLVKEG